MSRRSPPIVWQTPPKQLIFNLNKNSITYNGQPLYVCRAKTEKAKTSFASTPNKADFVMSKGIISQDVRDEYCALYDLRNNTHILKATAIDYYPKIKESKAAYLLVYRFINEVRNYFDTHVKDSWRNPDDSPYYDYFWRVIWGMGVAINIRQIDMIIWQK